MGDRINVYDHIRELGEAVIEYIQDGERKAEKGDAEKIIKIYNEIKANPKTMQLEFIGPTE